VLAGLVLGLAALGDAAYAMHSQVNVGPLGWGLGPVAGLAGVFVWGYGPTRATPDPPVPDKGEHADDPDKLTGRKSARGSKTPNGS